ncbi:CHAD domain-containing protein [Massilia sp. ST3]|uniref:CYTH and CHAD domain-containing protein n=1 Tax=Massilia sp. ST3 TaxID=2824903 RepID=UPI001B81FCFF|nr:CHAD domain-containing protein [Massilia sp. ST3]MBQ5947179.1 CHAD domain-containing protein [Massilia sp. ST3]
METELTLKVPPAALERIRSHPVLAERARGAPREDHLTDTWYDTPERALWKHGLSLCVRSSKDKQDSWIQIARTPSSPHRRGAWESALPSGQPQPALLARQVKPAALARLLADEDIAARLQPVFLSSIRRTTWDIALPDGRRLACALDAGDLACGDRHAQLSELELELERGDPAELFALALALHQDIPLELAGASLAARGYAMLLEAPAPAVKAERIRLGAHMTLEDVFQCIGLSCLRQVEANLPGVLRKDAESLHQMRVGLRRLRALLDMFGKLAAPPGEIREGLDWLSGELGAARDWDVLAGSTLDHVGGIDPAALRTAVQDRANALHKQLLHTLHAPRYTVLMLQINGWLRGRQWRADGALPDGSPLAERAKRGMRPLLRKAEKRLARRIKALDPQNGPARHRVRIAAKKARYASEFFRDLLPGKRAKRYTACLSALQDRLGLLNDFAVADRLLDELASGHGQVPRQAAWVRGYLDAIGEAGSRELGKPLRRVAKRSITR